jgi:2-hydroxychromene-2-carboxylate isomerase
LKLNRSILMTATIDYFYAPVSPFSYLGGPGLAAIAAKHGATVIHKPFKILEVISAGGGLPLPQRPKCRQDYRLQELARLPRRIGLPLNIKPAYFPVDDTLPATMIIALQDAQGPGKAVDDLAQAFLRAVWVEEKNISDPETCRAIASAQGLDADGLITAAPSFAAQREANTAEAIARGVFGAPSSVLGDEIFWGQDRLDYLDDALSA